MTLFAALPHALHVQRFGNYVVAYSSVVVVICQPNSGTKRSGSIVWQHPWMYSGIGLQKANVMLVISGHVSKLEIKQIIFLVLLFQFHFHSSDFLFHVYKLLILVLQLLFIFKIFILFFKDHSLALFLKLNDLIFAKLWALTHFRSFYPLPWENTSSFNTISAFQTQTSILFADLVAERLLLLRIINHFINLILLLYFSLAHDFIHASDPFLVIDQLLVLVLYFLSTVSLFSFQLSGGHGEWLQMFLYCPDFFFFKFLLYTGIQWLSLTPMYSLQLSIFILKLFELQMLLFCLIFHIDHFLEIFIIF